MNAPLTIPASLDTVATRRAYVVAQDNETPVPAGFAAQVVGWEADEIDYAARCESGELMFLRIRVKGAERDAHFVITSMVDEISAPCEDCHETGRAREVRGSDERWVKCDCGAGHGADGKWM